LKTISYSRLPSDDHPDYEIQKRTYAFIKSTLGRREVTSFMAKTLYEPLYKLSLDDDDLCEQQRAEIEDEFYCRYSSGQNKRYWKSVGRLRTSNSSL
jgi:hypothetical protein